MSNQNGSPSSAIPEKFKSILTYAQPHHIQWIILLRTVKTPCNQYDWFVMETPGTNGPGTHTATINLNPGLTASGIFQQEDSGLTLSNIGEELADWLIKNSYQDEFFWTDSASFGTPPPGSQAEVFIKEREGEKGQ